MPEKISRAELSTSNRLLREGWPFVKLICPFGCLTPGSMHPLGYLSLALWDVRPLILFTHKEILSKSVGWWLWAIICLLCWKGYKAIGRKPFTMGLKNLQGIVISKLKNQNYIISLGLFCLERYYISKANAIRSMKDSFSIWREEKGNHFNSGTDGLQFKGSVDM